MASGHRLATCFAGSSLNKVTTRDDSPRTLTYVAPLPHFLLLSRLTTSNPISIQVLRACPEENTGA